MMIVKQQVMEVLGVNLSPSVSIKDRYAVRTRVMLNACLPLSWSHKSFVPTVKPTSASPAGYPDLVKVRFPVGSKDVQGVNGVRPRSQVRVLTLAYWRSLGVQRRTDPRIGPELC